MSPPERPDDSVLDALECSSGERPAVHLSGADEGEEPLQSPAREAFVPRRRGDYQIQGEIARGGMGRVLKAHDPDLGRDLAIKVLDERFAGRPDVLRRFVEEAQVGGQLQHPGVVPVYELGLLADERPYFTMKLVKGRTLAQLFAERSTDGSDRARFLRVLEAVAQTVAYAHSKGVVHRDLKPANVMVGAFGEVQVVDWGLAKVLRRGGVDDELRAQRDDATLIETVRSGPPGSDPGTDSLAGSVLGTPAYMPPEQARGEVDALDERADVFALGAILCELLTGRPPYVAREGGDGLVVQAARAKLDDARARLGDCGAEQELVELALQCLAPAPAARPRHAGAVAERISALLAAAGERARAAELAAAQARARAASERRARHLTLALAGTGLAAVVAVALGWGWALREAEARERDVRRAVDEVVARVDAHAAEGRFDDAAESAAGALVLVAERASDDELRARAEGLALRTRERAEREAEQRERAERDAALLARLEDLSLESLLDERAGAAQRLDAEFAAAFATWGLDVAADPVASVDPLRASGLADALAPALDDWAAVRREAHGWTSPEAEALTSLAVDLDPEPLRTELRMALIARDVAALVELAERPEAAELPASTTWVLGLALSSLRERGRATVLLEPAAARFSDDVRLRFAAADCASAQGRWDVALRHISAAAALRPDLPWLGFYEGECLFQNARYPAARRALARFLEHQPRDGEALFRLGMASMFLGDFEGAVAAFERLEELGGTSPAMLGALAVARRATGRMGAEDFDTSMDGLDSSNSVGRLAQIWMLLEQDFAAVDLDAVEALIENEIPQEEGGYWHLVAMLRLAQDRPQEALEACSSGFARGTGFYPPDKWVHLVTLRARALARLGQAEEARAWLMEARRAYQSLSAEAPQEWAASLARRQLDAARQELGD